MDIEKIKDTIRKMLNLAANDAAAEGEIANATRFAARLMEQHQLSEDDLGEADQALFDLEQAEMAQVTAYCGGQHNATWEADAAVWTCELVGGVKYYLNGAQFVDGPGGIIKLGPDGRPLKRGTIVFYGVAEDVEIARQVFAETITTIAALARLKFGSVYRGDGRCYCEGFVEGLNTQRRADTAKQLKAAHACGDGTTLALIEARTDIITRKQQLAKEWLREQGVRLGSAGGSSGATHYNAGAYSQGRSDGSRHTADTSRRLKIASA